MTVEVTPIGAERILPQQSRAAQRMVFFDGLRGVAALGVVLSHLVQHFYVPLYAPEAEDRINLLIASTPLTAFYNGQFSVWIFFVLSALVLSASVDRDNFPLVATMVRRYVRLTLPILAVTFLILVIAHAGLMATELVVDSAPLAAGLYPPDFAPGLGYWLTNSLFGIYITGMSDFENVLWTMKVEIWGSLYVFVLWRFTRSRKLRMGICAISFLALNALPDHSSFQGLALFPIGVLIYDIAKNSFAEHRGWSLPTWGGLAVLFLGILFGAWRVKEPAIPGADVIAQGLHAILPFIKMNRGEAQQLGAVLVVFAVAMTPVLQRALSTLPFRFLGAVSFPLYLCHVPIMATVGCVVFALSYSAWNTEIAALITVLATTCVALGVASLLTLAVERPSIRLSHAAGRLARNWTPGFLPSSRAVKGERSPPTFG
jgi:peptidoglycan/LPS O-acetylase OafA/YrhL